MIVAPWSHWVPKPVVTENSLHIISIYKTKRGYESYDSFSTIIHPL
jgi:hypothetical protein